LLDDWLYESDIFILTMFVNEGDANKVIRGWEDYKWGHS